MINGKYIFSNYLRHAGIMGLVALLFACSDEEYRQDRIEALELVRLTFNTRASAADKAERKEYEISTLRIYAFNEKEELVGYHYADYSASSKTSGTVSMKLPTGALTFCTIANETAAGTLKQNNTGNDYTLPGPTDGTTADIETLRGQITPDILQSLTFSALPQAEPDAGNDSSLDETGKKYTSPYLPMADRRTVSVSPQGSVNISLTRSVAKMKLYFSTTGVGECYMGRGLYLYNEPQYGYLFPRDTYDGPIVRREVTREQRPADYKSNEFYKDSYLNQLNGRIILNCGWPEEPESYSDTEYPDEMKRLDINWIDADMNDPDVPQYAYLPQKSFYLFANSHQIGKEPAVTPAKPEGKGYYLKILVHQHGVGQEGVELHQGETFYLSLPAVKANDRVSVYSIVSLDGHVSITPHWMIQEWQDGGGDIEFN